MDKPAASTLLTFTGSVRRDPAIEVWMKDRPRELGHRTGKTTPTDEFAGALPTFDTVVGGREVSFIVPRMAPTASLLRRFEWNRLMGQEVPMSDVRPAVMLIVRGLKSELSREEFERRYKERLPRFREVPGLVQKYYAHDASSGEWAGIYLWDSEESLAAYLESDLRKTIATAYELTEPPRVERFPIVDVLREPARGGGTGG